MLPQILRSLVRSTPTAVRIPNRLVLSITGSNAPEFLNGLLTTSLHEPVKGPMFSAFLHAQGRVLYDVFIYTGTDPTGRRSFLLESDSRPTTEGPQLLSLLKRHVLRSKVKVRDVSEEFDVWSTWGSEADKAWETKREWTWSRSGAIEPLWSTEENHPWGTEEHVIRDRRAVGLGRRLLAGKGVIPQAALHHDKGGVDDYTLHRILLGVPEGVTDIPPMQAFPMDSNLDIMGGLDFRKGCYVGQELTVRTYHTGVVRKRVFPVMIHSANQKVGDVDVTRVTNYPSQLDIRPIVAGDQSIPRPRGTGKLLTSMRGLGLALLRLEQVDAAKRGDIQLLVDIPNSPSPTAVSPWQPEWWPSHSPS